MAVYSIVKLSQLEGAKRIDAEYYKPELMSVAKIFKKRKTFIIGRIADVVDGPFGSSLHAESYVEKGIPFLRVHNVTEEGLLSLSELVFISEEDHERLKSSEALPGDVVITKTGWVGFATVITDEIKKCNYRADLAKIRIRTVNLDPYFLAAFLNSKSGRLQTKRLMSGARGDRILAINIKKLVVPHLDYEFQKEIKRVYSLAIELSKTAISLYSQAENLLLEELGLKDFKIKYKKTYTARLSDAFSAHRIDAEYFQPGYEEVEKKIIEQKVELKKLGTLAEGFRVKIKPEKDKIYRYIEISDVSTDIGEINYTERLGKDLPPNARISVQGGELIISKVRPTRGAIAILPFHLYNNFICSSAFSVFNVISPLKEYIYMVVRSMIGKMQLEKPTTGTSYPTIDDRDVEKLKIPLLPLKTQQKIASLVQKSHEARKKAKNLLEVAKKAVEIAIEKGEEEASKHIKIE